MSALARIVSEHPKRVLAGATVLLVAAAVFGGPLIGLLQTSLSDFEDPSSQTAQVARGIERAIHAQDQFGLVVLLRGKGDVLRSSAAREQEAHIATLLRKQPGFVSAVDYADSEDPELISRNRRQALILATYHTRKRSYEAAERVRKELGRTQAQFGGLDVIFEELTRRSRSDLERAELLVLPLLILISLWVFRGTVAALLPLVVGTLAILITFLCLRLVDQFLGLSVFALNLVSALGLGLAIDYSLFILSRYREELARDADQARDPSPAAVRAALARTLPTAGRTVLYSSVTVAAAVASLLVFPLPFLYSMGIAGIFTALLAGASALIVLPAILAVLGKRIDALTPAWMRRSRERAAHPENSSFWSRLARTVMRRPGLIALATGGALLLAGLPALQMGLTPASSSLLPTSSQPRQVDEAIKRNFAGNPALPIAMTITAPLNEFEGVFAFARSVARLRLGSAPAHLLRLGSSTWTLTMPPRGDPFSKDNERFVKRLRALQAPYPLAVGGITAWFMDELTSLKARLPLAFAIVAFTMFATIFAMTGSVVLPVKMLIMNLLTLTATTGALVLGFQKGGLGTPFDFRGNGGLEPSNLVLLYIVAFALASDYGVFLLGRIKEAHDSGLPNREAVAVGVERTGRIITAAALLFCVAVGALVTSSILAVKELGFGAALAVAVDATLVRALLVPSLMVLLGDWNWWSPRPLRRLHARLSLRGEAHSA
jgi:RND superfamily putative drug exporter